MARDDDPEGEAEALYRRLAAALPDYFANPDTEGLVILMGEAERRAAEAEVADRLAAEGRPRAWARAGAFYEDAWLYCLRDVVRFPDGSLGTHHRILHKGSPDGVAILPRWQGRLVLLRHFRHGIRDWSLEFPRGGGEAGKAPEALARGELREELGAEAGALRPLGVLYPQNNIMATRLWLFLAELETLGSPNTAEGIADIRSVTVAELERLIDGDIVTDSASVALYTRARLKGLL
ncbi:MAG: NUDIX domain-containing protein [Alphaproteobacteria bacterium]